MTGGDTAAKVVFCLCGPKGSLCCFILSLWGSLMLFLLGAFYYVEAVVLLEDFIESVEKISMERMTNTSLPNPDGYTYLGQVTYYGREDISSAYQNAAYSCWGAGVIYLAFLILSGTFIGINIWRSKVKAN